MSISALPVTILWPRAVLVLALGTSGALSFFAPLQSWMAGLSVVLLVVSIGWRWRGLLANPPGPVDGLAAGDPA